MYHRSKGLSFAAALRDIGASQPRARVAAAEVLASAANEEERDQAFAALSPALGDPRPEVRSTACMSLADLERPDAWELIALCLSDSVPEVRQSAAIALGTLAAPESFDSLAEALRDGPADLRFQVATSLAEVDLERAYDPLLLALQDSDPEVLGAVALSLGATGNAACADQLALLLDHPRPQTRFDAAYALAQLGDPRARETLAAALCDEEGGWDAVIALEDLGSESIPALREFVEGNAGAPAVRLRAAGSLLKLSDRSEQNEGARRCLLAGLRSRKQELRGLALQWIEQYGDAWAVPPLRALRGSFRARRMHEDIDAALTALAERSQTEQAR